MRGLLVVFGFVAILLMGSVGMLNSGFSQTVLESQPTTTVTNESWTVDIGNVTALNNTDRDVVFEENVTVRNASGVVVEPTSNYSWIEENGSIRAESGFLSDGESATVTYNYSAPTSEQRLPRDLMLFLSDTLGGDLLFIMGLIIVLAAIWVSSGVA